MFLRDETLRREERIQLKLREIYEQFGYARYRMDRFEEAAFYLENKNFLASDRFITLEDANGRLMALKPDVTLSIVKNTKEAAKVSYNERIFRFSGKSEGFRELEQSGLECIGRLDDCQTAEVVYLACESMAALEKNWVLCLSHMGLISGVLDALAIPSSVRPALFDAMQAKSLHEISALSLNEEQSAAIRLLLECEGEATATLAKLEENAHLLGGSQKVADAITLLKTVCAAIPYENKLRLDFSVISDTDYYTGILFEGFAEGVADAVLVGGRYDNLLKKLGKDNLQGMGFAVNLWVLEQLEKEESAKELVWIPTDEATSPADLLALEKALAAKGVSFAAGPIKPSDATSIADPVKREE